MRTIFKWLDGLLDRILCVTGAAVFSQFPEFIQQYLQRLGGHADEAQRQAGLIKESAQVTGKTVNEYIAQFVMNADPAHVLQGEIMRETIQRAAELNDALRAIQDSSVYTRLFVFLSKMDVTIAKGTLDNYRPAIPLSLENVVYAIIGILIVMTFYHLALKWPFRTVRRAWERRHMTTLSHR